VTLRYKLLQVVVSAAPRLVACLLIDLPGEAGYDLVRFLRLREAKSNGQSGEKEAGGD
jgi:hypothetical protein